MESMEIKLTKLYNTLATISTKGNDTKAMAECLRYLEDLVKEEHSRGVKEAEPKEVQEV